jgi:hypothetical protein
MTHVEDRHQPHAKLVPPAGRRPAGQQRVVRRVQGSGHRAARGQNRGSADRPQVVGEGVVDGRDGALFRAPRRQQPGRHDQQQPPQRPGDELERGVPRRAQRAQRPEAE